ncbi:Permease of the drug/metabolite transporter (DMT) superfamily protein [Clostridiaceae bacterium JG1575]|nr:Permease of the drug/metabolite transporter (DMT) superfamily protein [Clostridiaceae bacterium JG1575]
MAIRFGLNGFPPLFLVFLRFFFTVFPALFFMKKPPVPWGALFRYGFFMGIGQFGLLFYAMHLGMPAGIASVLLQSQVLFALALSRGLLKEPITGVQILGLLLSVVGVLYLGGVFRRAGELPELPFFMTLGAAFCFGAANVQFRRISESCRRQNQPVLVLPILVWSSLFVPLPMLVLSLWVETPAGIAVALREIQPAAVASLAYIVVLSTFLAYGLWNWLISEHSASRISPFSLLVPVAGVFGAVLILKEPITSWQVLGMALTGAGLLIATLGPRLAQWIKRT